MVATMGAMVVDLPPAALKDVAPADIVSNLQSIRQRLQQGGAKPGHKENRDAIRQIVKKVGL